MGQGFKAQPRGLDALTARLRELERRVDALTTAPNIRNTTVSSGGVTAWEDDNGNQVVKLGQDSAGSRGMALTTPDGVDMLDFEIEPTLGTPVFKLNDLNGGPIFISDSDGSGSGLAWPWLAFPMAGMTFAQWPANNTGSFVTIAQAQTWWISQRMRVEAATICDSGATAGQVALFINGTQAGSTKTVSTSIGDAYFGAVSVPGILGDSIFVELKARVTAGAGNCRAQVYQSMWVEFEAT